MSKYQEKIKKMYFSIHDLFNSKYLSGRLVCSLTQSAGLVGNTSH